MFTLVGAKMECSGSEISKGHFHTPDECFNACKNDATMFTFGTNEYGEEKCGERGCKCFCQKSATSYGTCDETDHNGYMLYKTGNYIPRKK